MRDGRGRPIITIIAFILIRKTVSYIITISQNVLKTSWRRMENKKLLRWRRIEDVCMICLIDVFKPSWRLANVEYCSFRQTLLMEIRGMAASMGNDRSIHRLALRGCKCCFACQKLFIEIRVVTPLLDNNKKCCKTINWSDGCLKAFNPLIYNVPKWLDTL